MIYYPTTLSHVAICPIETQYLPFKYQSEMSLSKQYHIYLMPINGAKHNDFIPWLCIHTLHRQKTFNL